MKKSLHLILLLPLLLSGCSLLHSRHSLWNRLFPPHSLTISGIMEFEIIFKPASFWPGGKVEITVDFERGVWWQQGWREEERESLPFGYSLSRRNIELDLPSEETTESTPLSSYQERFLISIEGSFRKWKRRKGVLIGPLEGEATGIRITRNHTATGHIEYTGSEVRWEGEVIGYPLDAGERVRTITVRR